ncbi:MAG: MBL fold metallo-hydrolase [Peptostreptococcaceae bacterium]|nr:MBL fold metallo-hydrolase [Peptostreptococcaceae bacterium]
MKYISLSSGSCGNSHYIEGKDAKVIVDAGISGKKILEHLAIHGKDLNGLDAILVTHEHFDHIQAVGILSRKFDVPIYATEKTWGSMRDHIGKIAEKNIVVFEKGETLGIGSLEVDTFAISHDAADPVGYAFRQNGHKLAVVTDLGMVTEEVFDKIKGADIAVVESNYDDHMLSYCGYTPQLKRRIRSEVGHLSNSEAGYLSTALVKTGTKKILLAHLSKESNLPQIAFQTVGTILTEQGLGPKDVSLDVMLRGKVSRMYSIE